MASSREPQKTCPVCGDKSVDKFRPFCSRRCAAVDLGKWFSENYRIEAENEDEADFSVEEVEK